MSNKIVDRVKDAIYGKVKIQKLNKGLLDDYQCRCRGGDDDCEWICHGFNFDWCGISPMINFDCPHRKNP